MAVKNLILAIPLGSIVGGSLTGVYQSVIPGGLPHACFLLRITNDTDEPVLISYDGTTDNELIIDGLAADIPSLYSSQPNTFTATFAKGMQIYAKGDSTTGALYISGYYQPQT